MVESLVIAFLAGFIASFVATMPPGPSTITVINESLQHGLKRGLMISVGAALGDLFYAALAFTGFSAIVDVPIVRSAMQLIVTVILFLIGLKYLFHQPTEVLPFNHPMKRSPPQTHNSLFLGLFLVVFNPGILLLWISAVASFLSNNWVSPADRTEQLSCLVGIFFGAFTWLALLSLLIHHGRSAINDRNLMILTRAFGAILLAVGLGMGYKLILILSARSP